MHGTLELVQSIKYESATTVVVSQRGAICTFARNADGRLTADHRQVATHTVRNASVNFLYIVTANMATRIVRHVTVTFLYIISSVAVRSVKPQLLPAGVSGAGGALLGDPGARHESKTISQTIICFFTYLVGDQ